MTGATSVIASSKLHPATPLLTNKRENIFQPRASRPSANLQLLRRASLFGAPRLWNGATTLPRRLPPVPLRPRRDSRQSLCPGHDLSAGFSCGGFSPLDIRGVESSPSRASRFEIGRAHV